MSYIFGLHSLNSCCMGFLFTIFFWKGSHIFFWNFFLRTFKDFLFVLQDILQNILTMVGSLHLHILWEIIRGFFRITFVEWLLYGISFYNIFFGKVLEFFFWNLFLRTFKDFLVLQDNIHVWDPRRRSSQEVFTGGLI